MRKNQTKKRQAGFTLIEMLIVIGIIAALAALVIPMIGGVREEASNTTTLSEMKTIKEAIRDRFYTDLGLIPEDLGGSPEYATRFLCLINNGSGDINTSTGDCSGSDDCKEMCEFLKVKFNNNYGKVKRNLHWDKYSSKGWRGPYIEREITALIDDNGTPDDPSDDLRYPVLIDAWGKEVGQGFDPDEVVGEYRIVYDEIDGSPGLTNDEERLSARIVSRGNDVLIGDGSAGARGGENSTIDELRDPNHYIGDDLVMFIFGTGPTRSPE